jgi:hypothetical protein
MRTFRALAVTFALFAFVPAAQTQKIELSKFSCKDFVALNKDSIAMVWSWLYGYYADPDVDPMVDLADLAKERATAQRLLCGKPDGRCHHGSRTDLREEIEDSQCHLGRPERAPGACGQSPAPGFMGPGSHLRASGTTPKGSRSGPSVTRQLP